MKRVTFVSLLFSVLLIGGGFLVYFKIPTIVSNILTRKLDVHTTIKKIFLHKKNISLHSLNIQNPKGSSIPDAMKVKEIDINSSYLQLLADPVVIDEIFLKDVYVSLILAQDQKSACNWNILFRNMTRDKPKWYSIQRTALIKHLVLKNITLEVQLFGKAPQTLSPIESLEFYNIDVDKGIPTKEISNIIVSKMIGSIFSLESIKRLLGLPVDAFKFLFKPFETSPDKSNPCPMYKDYNDG